MVKIADKPFNAARMFSALQEEQHALPSDIGYVKPDPEDPGLVLFSRPDRDDEWTSIPEARIAAYEHLWHASRPDPNRQLVRLYLYPPEPPSEAALQFRASEAHFGFEGLSEHARLLASTATSKMSDGPQYCYYDLKLGYICVPI